MKKFILFFFMLMAASGVLRADDVTFEATVSSSRVSLDEALQLTLTVSGASDNLDPVSLPIVDGFTAKYVGPSSNESFVFVNGKSESHSEKSFIYELFPNKVGKFQIPAISVTIGGKTFASQPIDVEVFESSAAAQSSSGATDQDQGPSTESVKDNILLTASVDHTNVYLNERVPLTIKLLVSEIPVRDIQYPQFDKTGILVDDFDKPEQTSEIVNGIKYDTVRFKTYIYPEQLGDLQIGPAQIQGNILYKTQQQNPVNQENDFFGTDVFNNLFDAYTTRPVTITSQPIHLHVLSLPQANRPSDFSGAIGKFNFQASVSPLQVKVGDPITLKMDITGSGNLKNLKMPVFHGDGFKSYDPQIKNLGDEKIAEEVIIPTSAGIKEVPALQFSYFDTSVNDYKTITQGPFAIQVTAPAPDQEFKAVGFTDVSREPAVLPSDQFSLGKISNKAYQFLSKLFGSVWFWVSLGIILVAWVAYILWRRFKDRLRGDPAFRRRHIAVREAKQALSPAEGYISTGNVKDFYGLLSKVLRDYLANKWHRSSAALSVQEILSGLKKARVDEAHIAQVKALLEQADLVCFAGGQRSSADMRADLSQIQDLIAYFEKTLK